MGLVHLETRDKAGLYFMRVKSMLLAIFGVKSFSMSEMNDKKPLQKALSMGTSEFDYMYSLDQKFCTINIQFFWDCPGG